MKTTLNIIKEHKPYTDVWMTLLKHLGKTKADDDPLDLMVILESNGIEDAVWCLRCFEYTDYCLFLADIAESELPIYEEQYPDDLRPRRVIESIREYKRGSIDKSALQVAADAAYDAYDTAYYVAAVAAVAYYSAAVASDSFVVAADVVAAAADAAAAWGDADAARQAKWNEIETLFIKHFGQ